MIQRPTEKVLGVGDKEMIAGLMGALVLAAAIAVTAQEFARGGGKERTGGHILLRLSYVVATSARQTGFIVFAVGLKPLKRQS